MMAAVEGVTLAVVPGGEVVPLLLPWAIATAVAGTMAGVVSDFVIVVILKFLALGAMSSSQLGFFVTVFCAKDFDRVRRLYLALGTPFL